MLPQFDAGSGYLPRGVHRAPWVEVDRRFGHNSSCRARLIGGLLAACRNLAGAGCRALLLDGSFVTAKLEPGDYDGACETAGVNPDLLDPVLLGGGSAMRARYLGDLYPASGLAAPGMVFRDFFQTDRDGVAKGIVLVDLGSLP